MVWHFSFLDEATDDSFRGILVCIDGEEDVGVFCPVGVCYCCLDGNGAGEEGGGVDPFLLAKGSWVPLMSTVLAAVGLREALNSFIAVVAGGGGWGSWCIFSGRGM